MKRSLAAAVLVVLAAACVQFSKIEPRTRTIADLYTVEPQIVWSAKDEGKSEIWTVDGPDLQSLRFVNGLRPGDTLVEARNDQKLPTFRSHMTASEVMEFVVDSMSAAGMGRVEGEHLRPAEFGGQPGFRFDLSFALKDGLEMQGKTLGIVHKERLYLIMYYGARQHYFAKHAGDAEQVFQSVAFR